MVPLSAVATLRPCRPLPVGVDDAPREVVLAGPRSFCAGVERAIDIVERALDRYGAPVYVRRQIVHNAHVVRALEQRGAVFVLELDEVPMGPVAVLAAHGVSPAVRAEADARRLTVVDATCPLVAKVHTEVRRYAGRGDTVFLIGHRDHEEVEGTVGEAPGEVLVVEDVAAARAVVPPDAARVAYVMQTTLAVDEAEEVAGVLRERFPTLSAPASRRHLLRLDEPAVGRPRDRRADRPRARRRVGRTRRTRVASSRSPNAAGPRRTSSTTSTLSTPGGSTGCRGSG